MILFVKKGKGMGCGCLAQLFFLGFIALLIGSCQEFVTAIRHKEQLVIGGEDFIVRKPGNKWVKLTNVQVDLGRIITMSVSNEVLFPVVTNLEGNGDVRILLSVKNREETDIIRKFAETPEGSESLVGLAKALLERLNRNGVVEGTVRYGFNDSPRNREKMLELLPDLDEDFVILEHGDRPGFGKAGAIMGFAFLIFGLSVFCSMIGDKLNGRSPKPPLINPGGEPNERSHLEQ